MVGTPLPAPRDAAGAPHIRPKRQKPTSGRSKINYCTARREPRHGRPPMSRCGLAAAGLPVSGLTGSPLAIALWPPLVCVLSDATKGYACACTLMCVGLLWSPVLWHPPWLCLSLLFWLVLPIPLSCLLFALCLLLLSLWCLLTNYDPLRSLR